MRYRLFAVAFFALLALSSCKTEYDIVMMGNDQDAKYKMAFEMYDAGKFGKAADMFESLSMLAKGTEREDTVQFYWGMSNFKFRDYATAEANLNQFIMTYPLSSFSEEAQYTRLLCLYNNTYRYELDQQPTHMALSAMGQFIRENPTSSHIPEVNGMMDELNGRLELKSYKAAYLYYHMDDYLAAHYALKNVLKENADNRYREDVLYYTAMSAYHYAANSVASKQRERYLTFVDDYFNVIGEFPDSKYAKELNGLYKKVQKILNKEESDE